MFLLPMIKYPKFLEAGAAKDTGAINCVVSLPDSGVSGCSLSLGRIIKVYSSLRICLTQCRGDAGPRTDHRVTRRPTTKPGAMTDQSEARGEAR